MFPVLICPSTCPRTVRTVLSRPPVPGAPSVRGARSGQVGGYSALAFAAAMAFAGAARADPCTAPVSGHRPGQIITGQVRYVGDGDSLCVGKSPDPRTWIEIRIADWSAPELNEPGGGAAKAVLAGTLGKPARCTVRRGRNGRTTSYGRVIASCRIAGMSVRERMKRAGLREGGR